MKRLFAFLLCFSLIQIPTNSFSAGPGSVEINLQEFSTDKLPFSISTSDGQVLWIASWYKNSVSRFDVKTKTFTDSIPVGVNPTILAISGLNLWVGNYDDNTINVINTQTKSVTDTIKLPNSASKITSGGKFIWVQISNVFKVGTSFTNTRIMKFDGATRQLLSTWDIRPCSQLPCDVNRLIDGELAGITSNSTSSWFCYRDKGKTLPITQINASTDGASRGLGSPDSCSDIFANDDYLAVSLDQTIYLYDARDLTRLGSISVDRSDGFIQDFKFTESSIFVSVYDPFKRNRSTFLYDFDLKSRFLKEKVELPEISIYDFLVTTDQVWAIGITQLQDGGVDKSKLISFTTFSYRAKVRAEAEALAKAEAEAKLKAEAEAKAKQETEAKLKAEADARAKQEAEAKAAADKAAAELKARQDAEAKAKAKVKADVTKNLSTISCIKGKSVKKVTAVNPKCPKGYKKK